MNKVLMQLCLAITMALSANNCPETEPVCDQTNMESADQVVSQSGVSLKQNYEDFIREFKKAYKKSIFTGATGYPEAIPVSGAIEAMVREVFQELGMQNETKDILVIKATTEIAAMYKFLRTYYCLIHEDYFNTLPVNQQRAIIAHEAMHFKNSHLGKRQIAGIFLSTMPFVSLVIAYYKFDKDYLGLFKDRMIPGFNLPRDRYELGKRALFAWMTQPLIALANAWFSRHTEYEADAESVKALNDGQAFIEWMEAYGQAHKVDETKTQKFLRQIFSTHPDWNERIEYIKAVMAQEQAKKDKNLEAQAA